MKQLKKVPSETEVVQGPMYKLKELFGKVTFPFPRLQLQACAEAGVATPRAHPTALPWVSVELVCTKRTAKCSQHPAESTSHWCALLPELCVHFLYIQVP